MGAYVAPLAGGMLIGLSAALLMLLNGRVAGVSGIVARLTHPKTPGLAADLAFVLGLLLGPVVYLVAFGAWPVIRIETPALLLVVAGFLVGFGSRLGSGCTSGHGVVGLARLSRRSIVAVAVFMTAAVATVFVMRAGGLS